MSKHNVATISHHSDGLSGRSDEQTDRQTQVMGFIHNIEIREYGVRNILYIHLVFVVRLLRLKIGV